MCTLSKMRTEIGRWTTLSALSSSRRPKNILEERLWPLATNAKTVKTSLGGLRTCRHYHPPRSGNRKHFWTRCGERWGLCHSQSKPCVQEVEGYCCKQRFPKKSPLPMAVKSIQLEKGLKQFQRTVFCYVFHTRVSGMWQTVQRHARLQRVGKRHCVSVLFGRRRCRTPRLLQPLLCD